MVKDNGRVLFRHKVRSRRFTRSGTCPSSSFWSRERRALQTRRLRERRGSSLQSIRGTCRRLSFCGLPHPVKMCQHLYSRPIPIATYLLRCNWFLRCFGQLFDGLLVVSKVVLATDENDWEALAEVKHFGDPLWN